MKGLAGRRDAAPFITRSIEPSLTRLRAVSQAHPFASRDPAAGIFPARGNALGIFPFAAFIRPTRRRPLLAGGRPTCRFPSVPHAIVFIAYKACAGTTPRLLGFQAFVGQPRPLRFRQSPFFDRLIDDSRAVAALGFCLLFQVFRASCDVPA